MKRISLTLLLCVTALWTMAQGPKEACDYVRRVNVFIGTNGMGHTFPGACFPYGFVQLSPDTDTIPHNVNGVYQPRVVINQADTEELTQRGRKLAALLAERGLKDSLVLSLHNFLGRNRPEEEV